MASTRDPTSSTRAVAPTRQARSAAVRRTSPPAAADGAATEDVHSPRDPIALGVIYPDLPTGAALLDLFLALVQITYCFIRDFGRATRRGWRAWRSARRRRSFRVLCWLVTAAMTAIVGAAVRQHFPQLLEAFHAVTGQ